MAKERFAIPVFADIIKMSSYRAQMERQIAGKTTAFSIGFFRKEDQKIGNWEKTAPIKETGGNDTGTAGREIERLQADRVQMGGRDHAPGFGQHGPHQQDVPGVSR